MIKYKPTSEDKLDGECYDMLDHAPVDAVIAQFGLHRTLRMLRSLLEFHSGDNDEPLLDHEEKDLAAAAVKALNEVTE